MRITNLKDKLITGGLFAVIITVFIVFQLPCPFLYFFNIPPLFFDETPTINTFKDTPLLCFLLTLFFPSSQLQ